MADVIITEVVVILMMIIPRLMMMIMVVATKAMIMVVSIAVVIKGNLEQIRKAFNSSDHMTTLMMRLRVTMLIPMFILGVMIVAIMCYASLLVLMMMVSVITLVFKKL